MPNLLTRGILSVLRMDRTYRYCHWLVFSEKNEAMPPGSAKIDKDNGVEIQ
jgi:hypothetical protein